MICGIDFGTSNSSCTLFDPKSKKITRTQIDAFNQRDQSLLRSLLFFPEGSFEPVCGIEALYACAQQEGEGRFIASIKSHLATPHLTGTELYGRQVTLPQLVACLLRRIRESIPQGVEIERLNAGRPVRFSTDNAEDALAQRRLAEAYRLAGFPEPNFVPEPLAAAYALGEEIPRGVRVLVSDFGGGTLDFSLVIFEPGEKLSCKVLSTHGIWLGGDLIDGTMMYRLFKEYFGSEVEFWNWDRSKLLRLPSNIFTKLSHWRNIWNLRQLSEQLHELIQWGVTDEEPIQRLAYLLEDLVVPVEIFAAIEKAKVVLSDQPQSLIQYRRGKLAMDRAITIQLFEDLVASEVERFGKALSEVLRRASMPGEEIEVILCTGGSSQIPVFQRELRRQLPNAEMLAPDYFNSVSQGLARFVA